MHPKYTTSPNQHWVENQEQPLTASRITVEYRIGEKVGSRKQVVQYCTHTALLGSCWQEQAVVTTDCKLYFGFTTPQSEPVNKFNSKQWVWIGSCEVGTYSSHIAERYRTLASCGDQRSWFHHWGCGLFLSTGLNQRTSRHGYTQLSGSFHMIRYSRVFTLAELIKIETCLIDNVGRSLLSEPCIFSLM